MQERRFSLAEISVGHQSHRMRLIEARFAAKNADIQPFYTPSKKMTGMKLGRPRGVGKSKLDAYRPEIEALLQNGSTQKFIANRYYTTEANLYHWMRKHGIAKQRA